MVALRIRAPNDASGEDKYLVEIGEKFSDDRERKTSRLPGGKKSPHENTKQVVEKIVTNFLGHLSSVDIKFDYSAMEAFEEDQVSPSYPGVRTVYRKVIVEGTIEAKPDMQMERFENNYEFDQVDFTNITKFFKWMKRGQCDSQGIQYESPKDWTYSALVQAPIGMNEEDLSALLTKNKIDVSLFGQGKAKTLHALSTELLMGECTLVNDPDSGLVRVVEPILLNLVDPSNEKLLVQTEQMYADGTKVELNRLPGTKRRPDENVFLSARRIIERNLKIDLNHVIFSTKGVEASEADNQESVAYPGLPCVYQKRTVWATVSR